jgi:hypothetical protein
MLASAILVHVLIQAISPAGLSWNFSGDALDHLPKGWETRGNSRHAVYRILADSDGNRYLAARSADDDVQLGIPVNLRAEQIPILSWRWRAWVLPRGGDERQSKTLDSAASVYAVFGSRLLPRILKYVWSTSVPAGSTFPHPSSSRMVIMVVNSGGESLGQWKSVSRDLSADYEKAFGSRPPNLIAIGVKTDSDSTSTTAQADYDDIRLARQ